MRLKDPFAFAFSLGLALLFSPRTLVIAAPPEGLSSVAEMRAAYAQHPQSPRLALMLSGALAKQEGGKEESRQHALKAIELVKSEMEAKGETAEGNYLIGLASLLLDRNFAALARFRAAVELEPESLKYRLALGKSLAEVGRASEAVTALEEAQRLAPENPEVALSLSAAYIGAGQAEKAIPLLEAQEVRFGPSRALFDQLLTAYLASGDVEKASERLGQLVEAGEISAVEKAMHLFQMLLRRGELREARRALQEAARAGGEEDPLVQQGFRSYYQAFAEQAEREENWSRAILYWERALETQPDDWDSKYRLAVAVSQSEDHERAVDLYKELILKKPNDPLFYARFARSAALEGLSGMAQSLLELSESSHWDGELSEVAELNEATRSLLRSSGTSGAVASP